MYHDIYHICDIAIRIVKEGGSSDPDFAAPDSIEKKAAPGGTLPNEEAGEWQKKTFTFTIPYDTYIGMDIEIDTFSGRRFWLDGFTLIRE